MLFKRYALSVQPGMMPARTRAGAAPGDQFLGVGAPLSFAPDISAEPAASEGAVARGLRPIHAYFRSGGAASALAELPQLPGSPRELAVVARSFDAGKSTLLTGRDADEAGLKARDLSRYSVILFSTHGLVSGELEGVAEPALVLSPPSAAGNDGLLTASEIALLRLSADWVILSACNTAAGGSGGSAAYSGLAQAFRFAGANALLVSHWPVRDDIAAFLTIEAARASQRGMRKDKALQHALRKLISSRNGPGIAPWVRDRIFDRYWRASHGSTTGPGLGLALSRAIAERHALTIGIEDAAPGARFVIERRA